MRAIDVACRKMIEKFGRTVVPFDPWRSVISVPHQRAAELEWSFPCEAKALLQRLELAAGLVTAMVDVETGSHVKHEPGHIDSIRELGMITTRLRDGQEMDTHFHDIREFALVPMPAGHADTLNEPIDVAAWRNKEKQTSTPKSPMHQRFVHSVGGAHQHEEAAPDPDGAYESSHQRLLSNLTSLPGNLNVVNKACIQCYDDLQKWVVPAPFTLLVLHYCGNEPTVVSSICRQSGIPMQSCDLAGFEKIF